MDAIKTIKTDLLEVGYREYGPDNARVVVLLHGFPYGIEAYEQVAPALSASGFRVLVPFLRGYGSTNFRRSDTMRSGEQSAIASDVVAFMDQLGIENAILAGYDWGGRAACIVAATFPNRVFRLVSGGGYNIQRVEGSSFPLDPAIEKRYWYQYYFHGERGRRGLERNRTELCKILWKDWSPDWNFDESTYAKTARCFENSSFVDVVIHSYRHRFGLEDGDPRYRELARNLELLPPISVPTIAIEGESDTVTPVGTYDSLDGKFLGRFERRIFEGVGHNLPQENPRGFTKVISDIAEWQIQEFAPNI